MAERPSRRPPWTLVALLLYGSWYLAATGVAAWRAYTPVPIWDMWHFVGFLSSVIDGAGWPVWWEQMNEHRIVLTRGLFWVDQYAFGGNFVFLITVNYLLVMAAVATLYAYLRARAGRLTTRQSAASLVVLGAWLLSWVQQENLAWAFQSQFFLAQLLPLLGFYALYRSTQPQATHQWFVAACLLGALSIGTMISGIMALPMMVLYAVVLRMGKARIGWLAALTAACMGAYLMGYSSPGGHGSVLGTLKNDPVGMLQYTLLYIGSPFLLLAKSPSAMWAGQGLGVLFLALTLRRLVPALRQPGAHALELSLLTFIAYVVGIAFGTGGGRLAFGLANALSSRYTTPTMMAWAALAILYWPTLVALRGKVRVGTAAVLVLLLALLMAVQMRDTRRTEVPHLRMTGALALLLEVHDARRTGMLIWDEGYGTRLAQIAEQRNLGIFSRAPLAGAAQALGQRQTVPVTACRAVIDAVQRISQDPRFVLVTGAVLPDHSAAPQSVHLLQPDGTTIGIGLTDRWRKRPVAGEGSQRVKHLTFTAYVRVDAASLPAPMVLTAPGTACSVPLTLPAPQ